MTTAIRVGVLALQGAFIEHIILLRQASSHVALYNGGTWAFVEVRTPQQLEQCDALIIPGGESTTVSLVAARSGLLEPLRNFVKKHRKPTWGTCAGLILLAESANRTKKGGQELVGGLDVRVNRNYFGRQTESFETELSLPFLSAGEPQEQAVPFNGIFIRAPIVEKLLPIVQGEQRAEADENEMVIAPSVDAQGNAERDVLQPVEIMATLPGRSRTLKEKVAALSLADEFGDVVAVRQGNVFGTSFHPELTQDSRIHEWWLKQIRAGVQDQFSNVDTSR